MQQRKISEIAYEIVSLKNQIHYSLNPFILSMIWIDTPCQKYGYQTGGNIVKTFLSCAKIWEGPDAERIKKELFEIIN